MIPGIIKWTLSAATRAATSRYSTFRWTEVKPYNAVRVMVDGEEAQSAADLASEIKCKQDSVVRDCQFLVSFVMLYCQQSL